MADENPRYMTTREVAHYLRLNEKKVYALVAKGKLPAARVSGKWLFPQALIDRWVAEHTVYPRGGLITGLLEDLLILQGSDDWLLGQVVDRYQQIRLSAVPANFVSHPRVARFLEFVLEETRSSSETPGYDKTNCGKLVVLGSEQSTP